jgi:hypothetical protein
MYSHRISAIYELKPTNDAKRLHYCDWFITLLQEKLDVLDDTFYTVVPSVRIHKLTEVVSGLRKSTCTSTNTFA